MVTPTLAACLRAERELAHRCIDLESDGCSHMPEPLGRYTTAQRATDEALAAQGERPALAEVEAAVRDAIEQVTRDDVPLAREEARRITSRVLGALRALDRRGGR